MFWKKYFFEQTPGILVKFCHLSELRLWRTGMLLLTKSKGHKSNAPYSGFPNHLQTKSNHYISICKSQIHYIKSRWETLQYVFKFHYNALPTTFLFILQCFYNKNFSKHIQNFDCHKMVCKSFAVLKYIFESWNKQKSHFAMI